MGSAMGVGTDAADDARLRHRDVVHQMAAWWGLVGAAAPLAALFLLVPFGGPLRAAQALLPIAVMVGVPATGGWLASRRSARRAEAGLMVLASWGLLALPSVVALPGNSSDVSLFVLNSLPSVVPLVGLALAGWALTRRGGLLRRYPAGWRHRLAGLAVGLAGLAVGAYGLAAVLPPVTMTGPLGGGLWEQMLDPAPWGAGARLVTVLVVAALGMVVARLDAALALVPAAIVTAHALQRVASTLLELAEPTIPGPGAVALHPVFAAHIAAAVTALAATIWLTTRARQRALQPSS